MEYSEEQLRLTKDFIPLHYEINLDIDIINLSYISKVEITIESQIDNPKYISLNLISYSKESKISNYELISKHNSENYIIEHLSSAPKDYINTIYSIYFSLKKGIKKGDILIFKCKRNDDIKTTIEGYGLYISFWDYKLRKLLDKKEFKNNIISEFKDKYNPTIEEIQKNFKYFKSLVISLNSSPIGLREIIPCFDEPSFKSTYKFSISIHKNFPNSSKNFTIVNNSDIEKIIEKNNKRIYIFQKIPKISTYLLTFTIGYYEYIEKYITKINNEKLRLRVYGPENQINKVDYCLLATEKSIKKYEKLFNIPYYMKKLDSIFVPNIYFSAMEFLGCITYKQELMIDKYNATAWMYRNGIRDVYHEVFHNWIGNLITMEFFDNTWLNEGITKFVELFTCIDFGYGYFCDIMRASYYYTLSWKNHAINNKYINNKESIITNFDNITYEKGGYVMNMLLIYFGKDKIFNGLKLMCERFKYKNIDENDFFNCMGEACNYDIKNLLYEWIYEKSFPILSVQFSENKDAIIIEQNPNFGNDIIFKIPIEIKTKNFKKVILIKEKTYILKLFDYNITYDDIINKQNFIVINNNIKSFCIVNYLDEILKDAIFTFYNNNKNVNNKQNNNEYTITDADIYQILILYSHIYSYNDFINDINKLKKVDNFEILYYIYYNYNYCKKNECQFFKEDSNNLIRNNNKFVNELMYNIIDYNNTELINKILSKFGNPINTQKDDESGTIEFERFFITIICIYKKDENIVKKIYEIFKNKKFNLYEINKSYRTYLPLILSEFMYLFPEEDKIKIYKSMFKYYEEFFYYFYFLDKDNFEYALNNLNNGISEDILDYYFDNYDKINIQENCKVESIIIDYFFKYINKLYDMEKNKEIKFQDYLFDICVIKNFDIGDTKFSNIYECYLLYVKGNSNSIDKNKLFYYCNEKYIHFEKINDNKKIKALKMSLFLT